MAVERTGDTKSVVRAVSLLTAFSIQEPNLSVTELARRCGMHKSSASRLLATLETRGFVRQDPVTSKYALGFRLLELASFVVSRFDLRQVARPVLDTLCHACQETTNLAVFDGREAVNIDQVLIPQAIQYIGWVGRRTPAHCSSPGQALRAWQPAAVIDQFLAEPLAPYTERTLTDPEALRAELAQIREQGYAIADEEFQEGLVAVAAPVFGPDAQPLGVISISAPTFRTPTERKAELARQVREAAAEISLLLGHTALLASGPHRLGGRALAGVGPSREG